MEDAHGAFVAAQRSLEGAMKLFEGREVMFCQIRRLLNRLVRVRDWAWLLVDDGGSGWRGW